MVVVGLTGGIGSGKSTVAALLREKGAVIIDADAITRELQEPGQPVFEQMVERFGQAIVAPDGTLDRAAMAARAFADPKEKADLEAIVHPAVGAEMLNRLKELADDAVVIYDVPLLVEARRSGYGAVIVVDVDPEVAVSRIVRDRNMSEADVRARIANQASRDERRAVADKVIDNSGSMDELCAQVNEVWSWIATLPRD
jgi:dephospho-CoA kinase